MVSTEVYIASTAPNSYGFLKKLQGQTRELTDEEIENWEETKTKIIDEFVNENMGILNFKLPGNKSPQGIDLRKWRQGLSRYIRFEDNLVVEFKKPVDWKPRPKKRLIDVTRFDLLKSIRDAIKGTKQRQTIGVLKTRIYVVRPHGRGTRIVAISKRTGKELKLKLSKKNLLKRAARFL